MNLIKLDKCLKMACVSLGSLLLAGVLHAQTVTNLCPNFVISWSFDQYGFPNAVGGSDAPVPNTVAGLAEATNWNDTWSENYSAYPNNGTPVTVPNLFDNSGATTAVSVSYNSYNGYYVQGSNPTEDADGTYNRAMLNGYLNAGPASWDPPITNSVVTLSNVPYAQYDVIVYFSSDTSGRYSTISDGTTSYSFSTVGTASVSGANALFAPATETNNSVFPSADFAFFPHETNSSITFTTYPKSGDDQWLGIASFQVVQSSNVYIVYGPAPSSQIVPLGQPASFSVMAGGSNPAYQWQHAGTNIANATNAAFNIAAAAAGQDGNYDVIVTNSFSSVTSAVATLTFYTPKTVEWDGNGGTWDTASLFWTTTHGSTTTNYTETDNTLFDPLGVAQSTVTLAGTYTPGSITVSNAAYTLTSGGIAGSGSTHVNNGGTLVWDTISTSTGPILIDSGGTLQLDDFDTAGSLGSGALTNNGALLFASSGSVAYGYPIYGTGGITNNSIGGTLTLGNSLSGQYLVQAGGGSLLLQGSNSITGATVVSGGVLEARGANCLSTAPVIVSGGELQLIFDIDFAGSSINLAGGDLHGGVSGDDIYEGQVILATDSQIIVDPNDSLVLNNSEGIAAAGYNLTVNGVGSTGTLILVGTNNTWESATVNFGTLQIGNGGNVGSVGGGSITDGGALAFDLAGNLTVTNPVSGSGELNQIGSGIVTFTGDLSGLSGSVTVSSGTLDGITSIGAPVNVLPGAALGAGTPSSIGTLTLNDGLTLGGNLTVKLNKSLAQSNDLFQVTGTLDNTNSGTVIVEDLGPAIVPGDKFTLFNAPVAGGGSLSVIGGGVTWSNDLANNGSIIALSAAGPTLVSVTPNPVSGSSYPVTLGLAGSGFVSGCTVQFTNVTESAAGGGTVTFNSSASLSVAASVGTAASSWTATVINPGGLASAPVAFSVVAPPSLTIAKSAITSAGAGNVVLSGSGGQPGHGYAVVSTTSLNSPVVWTPIVTNQFDGSGNFAYTNKVVATAPKLFLRIEE